MLIPDMIAVVNSFVPVPRTLVEVLTLASLDVWRAFAVPRYTSFCLARLRKIGVDFGHSATGEADYRVILRKIHVQRFLYHKVLAYRARQNSS